METRTNACKNGKVYLNGGHIRILWFSRENTGQGIKFGERDPGLGPGNVWRIFQNLPNLPKNLLQKSSGMVTVIFENPFIPMIKILHQYVG